MDPVHGTRTQWSAVTPAFSTQIAIERIDVFGAKCLQWEVPEAWTEMVVDDALGLTRRRRRPVG